MMRVMQVMAGAGEGGAETFFVDLVRALHDAGLEQRVVIRRNPARAAALRAAGIEPVELRFGRWLDLGTRIALRREIADFEPHVVQTWMSRASAAMPRGSFVHVGWLGGYYDLKSFRRCRHLVGVTRDIVAHMVKGGWPKERVHYLPTLASGTPAPPLSRATFDTPERVPLVLALGRLHVKKAFDILLQALANLPGVYLWLAGEGPLRAKLEAQARSLGIAPRVRFLGWRDDRAALFAACDLCVMPSRFEPFGTVMIEAWAHGKPLIAAAAQGPRGLVQNGENGLLVPVDDVHALATAMHRVIDQPDLARRLVETARREYEADYTEAAVVSRYLAFYERIAKPVQEKDT
jgi:glycosyltransferase involved in cell wall biosynthesis